MDIAEFQGHIRNLATLPRTEAPVISCYLRVQDGHLRHRRLFDKRIEELKRCVAGKTAERFERALVPIERFLSAEVHGSSKGAAVFSREGHQPYFLALQFAVPLPTWVTADMLPNIYHLVELKDKYWRFILLVCSRDEIRMLSVNLGKVTLELLRQRPELRRRVGREWTKEHYRAHRAARTRRFVDDAVNALSEVMSAGGYDHLILAGDRSMTALVRRALPPRTAARLAGIIRNPGMTEACDVVSRSIEAFIEAEEKESCDAAGMLEERLRGGGLAVAGTRASHFALRRGRVQTLVMSTDYAPRPGWLCVSCRVERTAEGRPKRCRACGSRSLVDLEVREAMLRLAEQRGIQVELVRDSAALRRIGDVGCLLQQHPGSRGTTRRNRAVTER
jgi:hypothetical protein